MKAIRFYLDEAAQTGIAKNDSDIARKLGVSRGAVCEWRVGRSTPNEDQAAALALLLGKPEIMAECMAARATPGPHRAAWERLAKMASMTTAYGVAVAVNLLLTPTSAKAAPLLEMSARAVDIMSTWHSCLSRIWRRRPRTQSERARAGWLAHS
jgi:hypothetical protein